jgi:uncharacterized protein (TIGR03083 family)
MPTLPHVIGGSTVGRPPRPFDYCKTGVMVRIDAGSIGVVTRVLDPERAALIALLRDLDGDGWARPTECPNYSVKGIASHILGDDLSLLSRQRDGAVQGLLLVAETMPGVDFRTLLNAFNDQWVHAAKFFSPALLIELLALAGDWTSRYYTEIDPNSPGEPVQLFGTPLGGTSPYWQAIAREYLERWAHHSQIRRALGMGSLADSPFLDVGVQVIATVAGAPAVAPGSEDGVWSIGPVVLGSRQQTADVLTLAHAEDVVCALVDGPTELVKQFATRVARRIET